MKTIICIFIKLQFKNYYYKKYCILLIDSLILENIMDMDLIIFSKENKKVNIKKNIII